MVAAFTLQPFFLLMKFCKNLQPKQPFIQRL
jgi:hypothetical protein